MQTLTQFTAEDAFEFSADGDPIMVTLPAAREIIESHDLIFGDFVNDAGRRGIYDAAEILGWLGY